MHKLFSISSFSRFPPLPHLIFQNIYYLIYFCKHSYSMLPHNMRLASPSHLTEKVVVLLKGNPPPFFPSIGPSI